MRIRVFLRLVLAAVLIAAVVPVLAGGQGGDQFLDGIGETALVARYVCAANTEDSSRNNFHAALRGTGGAFIEDPRFGRALELVGTGGYIQLPGHALAGEDTISVTGWFYLPTGASGPFFDFGQSASSRIFAGVTAAGFRASVVSGATVRETTTATVPVNQWIHVAVVLDPARRVLTTYLDGARVGQAADVAATAAQLINQASGDANRLYIGRSQDAAAATLQGRIRDIRVYRVALTDAQVATIHGNASGSQAGGRRGAPPPPVISTAAIPKESPLASRLARVPDITAADDRRQPPAPPARDSRRLSRRRQRPEGPCDLAGAQGQQPGGKARHLHRDGHGARHDVPAEGHGDGVAVRQAGCGSGAEPGAVRPRPRRSRERHQGARHAVHQEPRQVHPRAGRDEPRQLPLQLPGRVRAAAARGRQAARRVGQPDDAAARARQRALPVGHRPGVREHHVRRIAAGELPPEDELPDRHAARPVAEVRQAGEGRRPVQRRPDQRAAGRRPHGIRLEPPRRGDQDRLLELGTGVHQRVSAGPVHHAREGRDLRHPGHADLGSLLHPAQDPRRPAGLLRSGREPQGARDRAGHGRTGPTHASRPFRPTRASACGAATSRASTAA